MLTVEGDKTPMGKEKWSRSTVRSILVNEKYKANALLQKYYTKDYLSKKRIRNKGEVQQYYVKGSHEPIISPEVSEILDKTIFDTTGLEKEAEGLREELFLLTKKIEDLSLRNDKSIDNTTFIYADIEKEYSKKSEELRQINETIEDRNYRKLKAEKFTKVLMELKEPLAEFDEEIFHRLV